MILFEPQGETEICQDLKDMFHSSDQSLINSRLPELHRCYLLVSGIGYCKTQCRVICKKKGMGHQNIGAVIYVDEKSDWARDTALGHNSFHWERRGKSSVNRKTFVARVEEVREPGVKGGLYATGRELGKQSYYNSRSVCSFVLNLYALLNCEME